MANLSANQKIRNAIFAAPIALGATGLMLRLSGSIPVGDGENLVVLRQVTYGACLALIPLLFMLRSIRARQEPDKRAATSIAAWALGESGAVLGAVFLVIGGEPWPFCAGLVVLFLAWAIFPADTEQE